MPFLGMAQIDGPGVKVSWVAGFLSGWGGDEERGLCLNHPSRAPASAAS